MVPGSDEHTLYALLDEIQTDRVSRETVGLVIGGVSAASEATLSSCPLRFAVYVGLVHACNQSLRR